MHNNHTKDTTNKDINLEYPNKQSYLNLTKNFKSKLPKIVLKIHDGILVAREDLLKGGTKTRAAEFMFSQIKEKTVVYVAPRVGLAPTAICELAELYKKKVILFMPASKEISDHQAHVYNKAQKVFFKRIAAMPNLNIIARNFAKLNGYKFLPFGLNHPHVIAGFVRIAETIRNRNISISEIWTAVSTGVLTRGLQIGFDDVEMKGVCVARNMKVGEIGRTKIISEPLSFTTKEKIENLPPFDTVKTYDGKVWKYIPKDTDKIRLFWNVAGEIYCPENFDKTKINSYREW